MTNLSIKNLSLLLLYAILFIACSNNMLVNDDQRLEHALKLAKSNRIELEKVLNHYSENPEKLAAARWLIMNMPLHHTKDGDELEYYRLYFKESANHAKNPKVVVDSLNKIYGSPTLSRLKPIYDIGVVDSAFLVSHIDVAFYSRENRPWGKNVGWNDFCEFVLPYRLGDEPLSLWRNDVLERYSDLIDSVASLPGSEDPRFAANELYIGWLRRKKFKWTSKLPVGPRIGVEIIDWKTGACRERADGMCYLLRAAGLPAVLHRAPMRGDLNDSHSWGVIMGSEGSPWIPEQHLDAACDFKVPAAKVHCETYSLNLDAAYNFMQNPNAPNALRDPFFRDETRWYLDEQKRKEFKVPIDKVNGVYEGDTLFIAAPSRNKWVAIGYGLASRDSINFGYVGENTVCVIGKPEGEDFHPCSYPFNTTLRNDSIHFYTPGESIDINIYSKHTLNVGDFAKRMIGGVFENSDSPDFIQSDTLYLIDKRPKRLYTTIRVDNSVPKRYLRYYGADKTYCNIAEIKLYENYTDTLPLKGKIIGTEGSKMGDYAHEYFSAWDGDPYTSMDYHKSSGGWTGIDFGKPQKIEKIVYTPRNRGNFIKEGNTYELYYFEIDRGWQLIQKAKAMNDEITFKAPAGALLFLHCLDGGKDERIFEYDQQKDLQIFW